MVSDLCTQFIAQAVKTVGRGLAWDLGRIVNHCFERIEDCGAGGTDGVAIKGYVPILLGLELSVHQFSVAMVGNVRLHH